MYKRIVLFLMVSLLGFSASSHAAWYEVTGYSALLKSKSEARTRALEDAVFQAIQFAGGDITGVTRLKPFLSEQRDVYQFTGDEIREIQIVEERTSTKAVTITARVSINPTAKACHKSQYRKNIVLNRFGIVTPQHAALGGIFRFGDDFTDLLQRQFDKQSQSFVVSDVSDLAISPGNPVVNTMIADDNNAQYLISGSITDMTATLDERIFRRDGVNRQLALTIDVIDGKTGDVIYQNNYRDIAAWPFENTSKVDTRTARFWASSYGEMARRMSRNIMLDLESVLACRATSPEVVAFNGDQGQINVGRVHGVKMGDKLQLWHNASFIDQFGSSRNQFRKSEMTLTVTRVYDHSAEISVSPAELARSVQIGDLVTKHVN
ncbi:flagellar basal-body protein [Veronia nyctiphanis]|uniref:Flagellar basal-body protein n=1 Tax=Veronia nyctiphanis TaxID=1278244 RepID=A0A4Q0YUV1_9GAMM|nr:flagella assembly protein FlgT [Veronia nyctiphanis]RXJ72889.1 flagellar basal-body protein [Veronia nyctiphanis]